MTIDAKDVAIAGAAVGGLYLLSARAGADGGQKRKRRRKGGGGGGGSGGGAAPGPPGVVPVPLNMDNQGQGQGPIQVPGGVSVPDDVQRARTFIDAARGTGQAADAVLDTGSGGVDFAADVIGGDEPGAFGTTGGLTGASYRAGQLTGNVAREAKSAADSLPAPVVGGVPELLSEGPF